MGLLKKWILFWKKNTFNTKFQSDIKNIFSINYFCCIIRGDITIFNYFFDYSNMSSPLAPKKILEMTDIFPS